MLRNRDRFVRNFLTTNPLGEFGLGIESRLRYYDEATPICGLEGKFTRRKNFCKVIVSRGCKRDCKSSFFKEDVRNYISRNPVEFSRLDEDKKIVIMKFITNSL